MAYFCAVAGRRIAPLYASRQKQHRSIIAARAAWRIAGLKLPAPERGIVDNVHFIASSRAVKRVSALTAGAIIEHREAIICREQPAARYRIAVVSSILPIIMNAVK